MCSDSDQITIDIESFSRELHEIKHQLAALTGAIGSLTDTLRHFQTLRSSDANQGHE